MLLTACWHSQVSVIEAEPSFTHFNVLLSSAVTLSTFLPFHLSPQVQKMDYLFHHPTKTLREQLAFLQPKKATRWATSPSRPLLSHRGQCSNSSDMALCSHNLPEWVPWTADFCIYQSFLLAVCSYVVAAANAMTSGHVSLCELAFNLASQVQLPLNCSWQFNIHSPAMNLHKYVTIHQPLFEITQTTPSTISKHEVTDFKS